MVSLAVSTVAYFVAAYVLKHRFDEAGIPKTMSRGLVIFAVSMLISYGVGAVVDMVVS